VAYSFGTRSRVLWSFTILASGFLSACSLDYVPVRSAPVAAGRARVEPVALAIPVFAQRFEVTVSVTGAPVTIAKATLGFPTEAPCSGARGAASVSNPRGEVVVAFDKSDLPDDVDREPLRADLLLLDSGGQEYCVSVPVFSTRPEHAWEPTDRVAFFERGEYLWSSSSLENLHDHFDLALGAGYWVDDFLFAASVGISASNCPLDVCPPVETSDGESKRVAYGPSTTLEAGMWPLAFGMLSGGIAARYWAAREQALTHEGNEVFWRHGPRIVPKLGLGEKPELAPGLPAGARTAVIELEAPVGVTLSEQGPSTFVYGLGLRVAVTVW
jgi:hypothetical protein